jgi:D-inositol-3-phosphate glycosyltransferase
MAALALRESWQVPIVHMFHTLVLMKNQVAQSPAEIEGAYRLRGEQQVLQGADRIVAATEAEKMQLETLYGADPNKITIIPPGVDISHFYPIPPDEAKAFVGLPPDEQMILFVGRIEPLKGVEKLMRAIALMRQRGIRYEIPHYLTIIGGDPEDDQKVTDEMARLKRLCGELDICDMILFLGKRSQDICLIIIRQPNYW